MGKHFRTCLLKQRNKTKLIDSSSKMLCNLVLTSNFVNFRSCHHHTPPWLKFLVHHRKGTKNLPRKESSWPVILFMMILSLKMRMVGRVSASTVDIQLRGKTPPIFRNTCKAITRQPTKTSKLNMLLQSRRLNLQSLKMSQ